MNEQAFLTILAKLEVWQNETIEALRRSPGDQSLLRLKIDLGTAAGCLRLCQKYGIDGRWQPLELPVSDNAFSELRLLWDNETEDREHWEPLVINGKRVGAWPGDVLLCQVMNDGQRVAAVLRKALKQHLGPKAEQLAAFKLQPFRGRKAKNDTQEPGPAAGGSAAPVGPEAL